MKNKVIIHKRLIYYKIEIFSNNDILYNEIMRQLLLILHKNAYPDISLYIYFEGCNEIEKDKFVICDQIDPKNPYRHKTWIKKEWLAKEECFISNQDLFNIYLFDKDFNWNRFLKAKKSNEAYINSESLLHMIVSFGECQPITIYIKKNNIINIDLKALFIRKGYKISKTFL